MIAWVCIFLGIFPLLYLYLTWNNNHWKKKGIPQVDPLPGVGNLLESFLMKKCAMHIHIDLFNKFPEAPVVGFYHMTTPALLLRSPEQIQEVLVKDFSSFHDNYTFTDKKDEPYLYRNPFVSRGADWKINRSAMAPTFNVQKMKSIFPQMKEIAKQLEDYLDENLNTKVEAKNLAFLFTTDIVSNCGFGIGANSFSGNEEVFKHMGKLIADNFRSLVVIFAAMNLPTVAKLFKLRVIPDAVGDFLKNAIMQSADYRKKNNIERNDFMKYILSLEGKKINQQSNTEYSLLDVVGFAMTFFVEGFETSAITASFILYELVRNPDIQEKLRAEILSTVTKREELDYEKLHSMTYMDKVISESSRKYPVMFSMTRICTQDTILSVEGKDLPVKKGTPMVIPIYSIQNDPEYYPEPEKFDPERFSQESISSRPSYTYMPFGEGPRICVGMRFGLTQVKLLLATILLKYNVLPTKETPETIRFDKLAFLTTSTEELWMKFEKREI